MGFRSEKISIKEIVQRELGEIDAFLFEDGEIVKYEIALESVPEKLRDYARDMQAIYGWENEDDKVEFLTKEQFVKNFYAEYCATHHESVKTQSLESEMFAYQARKRKQRMLTPLILLIVVLVVAVVGFALASFGDMLSEKNGSKASVAQMEHEVKQTKEELNEVTEERDALQAQLDATETEMELLQEDVDSLKTENEELLEEAEQWRENKDRVSWYNANAVVVYSDGADLYHLYGCSRHQDVAYRIYDTATAKASGYLACPHCLGN